jgi:Spy/CpxP family protein refolding chaperone
MKTKWFFLLLVLVIICTGFALAQPGRFERGGLQEMDQRFRPKPDGRIKEFLKLTDQQIEAAKQIKLNEAKEMKPLKDQLRELAAKHQTLTTATKADMDAIYKSIEKIGGVKMEIAKVQAKQQQEFRALLTEEQLLKFDSFKDRAKEFPMNRFQQRRGRI